MASARSVTTVPSPIAHPEAATTTAAVAGCGQLKRHNNETVQGQAGTTIMNVTAM